MLLPRSPAGADSAGRSAHTTCVRFLIAACRAACFLAPFAAPAAAAEGEAAADAPVGETVVLAPPPVAARPAEDDAAAGSVVVPAADARPRAVMSLPDLLGELPGAAVTRLGGLGAIATVSLRGSSPEQVGVYLDGVPLNLALGGAVDLSTIPIDDADRIEVYRGMTPIAFAESALGGVVSITTRTPRETGGSAEAGVGSFGTRFAGAGGAWVGSRVRLAAGVHLLGSDGDFPFRDDNGTTTMPGDDRDARRANNALAQADGLLRAVVLLPGRRELRASLLFLARDEGIPWDALYPTTRASLDTTRGLATLVYESRDDLGPGGRLRALAFASALQQRFHDPVPEVGQVPSETRDRALTGGASLTASRPWGGHLRLSGVAEGRAEGFWPRDDARAAPDGAVGTRQVAAGGLEADVLVSPLALDVIPSLRLEAARSAVSGRDATYALVPASDAVDTLLPAARLALVQRPAAGVALKANAGRYARLPSLTELYGDDGYVLGTPGLRPETGLHADAGATLSAHGPAGSIDVDASGFAARVDDLIELVPNAQHVVRAGNLSHARVLGAEAALSVATRRSRLFAQVTFTDARDEGDAAAYHGRQLPLRPRYRAYLRPEARALALGRAAVLGAWIDADYTDGNYVDAANLVALPARLLVGAGLSVEDSRRRFRVSAAGRNLGSAAAHDVVGFPLPGRSLFVSLTVSSPAPEGS